jgi:uncharacterized protein (DUF58 family)
MKNPARALLSLVLVVGLVGMFATAAEVYARLFLFSAVILGVSAVWTYLSLRGIRVERSTRSLRASVGDLFEERFVVSNLWRLGRLWLEIFNESPLPAAAGSRVLSMISPRANRIYNARTWLTRRGAFSLGPTVIRSGDPFGIFRSQRSIEAAESLLVLPMLVNITAFPSPPGILPGGKAIRRKSYDVTPHAAGVREYATGDPLKRIHWPTTARRGQLMVKEFEQDPQAEVWIFIDAQRTVHLEAEYEPPSQIDWVLSKKPKIALPPSTMEYAVCIAASLAHYFLAQRRAVGLAAAGQVSISIPAERSERQEIKILETLAFVQGDGALSLGALVSVQAKQLPPGSSVILITPSTSREVILAAEELQRRNLHPIAILLNPKSFGGTQDNGDVARALSERNVPVCSISNGDDISAVLERFAMTTSAQEIRIWEPPRFIPST